MLDECNDILSNYGLYASSVEPLGNGLINLTLLVHCDDGEHYVLQRVNRLFDASVNDTIEQVTTHLAGHGVPTPMLVKTLNAALTVTVDAVQWRVLTYMAGRSFDIMPNGDFAREAGSMLGRFHAALVDFQTEICPARALVHDPERHLKRLRESLPEHSKHRLYGEVKTLAAQLFDALTELKPVDIAQDYWVHGDPKVSNILYAEQGTSAVCMVDLDTLGPAPLAFELGDAFRSWCNPHGEDAPEACFSLSLFEASLQGYAAAMHKVMAEAEWRSIVTATQTIALELAARFALDALREDYFAWDKVRFERAGEHNLARARGQIAVLLSASEQAQGAEEVVVRVRNDRF